jgi:hypothetical protein
MKTGDVLAAVVAVLLGTSAFPGPPAGADASPTGGGRTASLTEADYLDRVHAIWMGQMLGAMMGWQFEHKPAAVRWVEEFPDSSDGRIRQLRTLGAAPADDDWYYEIVALRALERHGVGLTVAQLGQQWLENNAGTWGSSEQARLALERGIEAPHTGHPRNNRLWFTMGNQARGELFGMLAPGLPTTAGALSRRLGHVNSWAEGTLGGVFVSGMISTAFCETDPQVVVRTAVSLLHPDTPHRRCLDQVLAMAEAGRSAREISDAVEDRWHIEYPATNNAVGNAGHAAVAVLFGGGDFLKTVNLAYQAADFVDADNNAAISGAVVAAMHGTKALPPHLVAQLRDRILSDAIGPLPLTPPLDERITDLAARTVAVGKKVLASRGIEFVGGTVTFETEATSPQEPELFHPDQFTEHWDPAWTLQRSGYGAPGGGVRNLWGGTFVDEGVLATFPRDVVRGLVLRRTARLGPAPRLELEVAAAPGRAWELWVYVDNDRVFADVIDGGPQVAWVDMPPLSQPQTDHELTKRHRRWRPIRIDLRQYAGREAVVRLIQKVIVRDEVPGMAYWKHARIEG